MARVFRRNSATPIGRGALGVVIVAVSVQCAAGSGRRMSRWRSRRGGRPSGVDGEGTTGPGAVGLVGPGERRRTGGRVTPAPANRAACRGGSTVGGAAGPYFG